MTSRLLMLHALSPIHCGTGQSAGGIDLPIARERSTDLPLVPGSSLKGVLRSIAPEGDDTTAAFGPPTDQAELHAGALQFSDSTLLCLPVRSLRGTVAWTTAPYLLRRFRRDAEMAGVELGAWPKTEPANVSEAVVTSDALAPPRARVILEDLDMAAKPDEALGTLADRIASWLFDEADERRFFRDRFCVVHDDVMSYLLRTALELTTRNRIDPDTGTVAPGALWTEEALPVESVLSGLLLARPVSRTRKSPEELLAFVDGLIDRPIQVGGNASVGRGLCRVAVAGREQ